MKARHLVALLPTALMTLTLHSDSGENIIAKAAPKPASIETPIAAKTMAAKPAAEQTPFIEYNNRMVVFAPFYQSYERTKPNAFYWGLVGYITDTINEKGHSALFAQADFRLGYNYFYNGRDHVTPYAGIGGIKASHHHRHWGAHSGVLFGELGFLYDHEFNRCFNLGVNAKGLVGGGSRSMGGCVFGFDVGVPFTFRFGSKRHWDFRLEPFNVYLHGSKRQHNYFGFRNAFAYRF